MGLSLGTPYHLTNQSSHESYRTNFCFVTLSHDIPLHCIGSSFEYNLLDNDYAKSRKKLGTIG